MRRSNDLSTEQDYLAVAPGLFWRSNPEIELDSQAAEEHAQVLDLLGQHDVDAGIRDVQATLS